MTKTFKEVVEEGKGELRKEVPCSNGACGKESHPCDNTKHNIFLDTFAAKIRQATLAEAREKIEGMVRVWEENGTGTFVDRQKVMSWNNCVQEVLALLDKDIT